MLPQNALKDLLAQDISDREKVLVCLATDPISPRQVKEITALAYAAGWRQIRKKNVSNILSRSNGLAALTENGWELTNNGEDKVAVLAGTHVGTPVRKTALALRAHLVKIQNTNTRSFVEEAVACFEVHQFRAAIVLSWVGAVSLLHNHIVTNRLAEFNAEALKRNPKWRAAKSTDDLGLLKEGEFLDILQAISILGKNVKQELKKALVLRNSCGHPNTLKIAEHKVASHIEDLILNVFSVF